MNYKNLIENLKPDVIGGQYLVQIRAQFDKKDKNIFVASNRQILQYDSISCNQVNKINPTFKNDESNINFRIVACESLDNSLYIFTTDGRFQIWNLNAQDWLNELTLPLEEEEYLISCKVLSKRQYVYTIKNSTTQKTHIYYSMSRSERERPKHREDLGECDSGELNTFDIGTLIEEDEITLSQESKSKKDKLSKQRILAFIDKSSLNFQRVAINEKLIIDNSHIKISHDLNYTCVRANTKRSMIAAGDSLGRIFLYTGDLCEGFNKNRTKLHWHSMPVNDLCFSSTGNTLFSVGGESGCVVVWDLTQNNVGKMRVIARLGMPIRFVNCGNSINQLILSFEDNEIQIIDTNDQPRKLKTFTRRTIDIYRENNYKALRLDESQSQPECTLHERNKSIGLLWHSKTDTVVTNAKTGWLQFYSPKEQERIQALNFLKCHILSLEKEVRVIPSDITRASITNDGNWLALYETRESESSFPDIKLHIWQRSSTTNRWIWIQTADRLHSSTVITDLKFSPDGQFLISVSEDGTFQVLHRVYFDSKQVDTQSRSKQMYAKGFVGNVPPNLPSIATFSQDSSVLAISLKNDTTLIWMIADPYKLVYECQLNEIVNGIEPPTNGKIRNISNSIPYHDVLGLHFGSHKPSQSLAPLCEVRTNTIRLWNILDPSETMKYSAHQIGGDSQEIDEFTSVAFDQCPADDKTVDHFAVSTKNCLILIFKLQITRASLSTTSNLQPIITINCSLPYSIPDMPLYYTHMCFVEKPILEIDKQCHQDNQIVKLLNRLCLMTNYQELVAITDKLTLERQTANTSCNTVKSFDMTELQAYFTKSVSNYNAETGDSPTKSDPKLFTEKQRRIRNRLEVQKMIKDLLIRVPSQNLPNMETLGSLILDKLI